MAQKVQVLLVDDVDGGTADETVTFALDGVSYEIDLTAGPRGRAARFVLDAGSVTPARRGPARGAAAVSSAVAAAAAAAGPARAATPRRIREWATGERARRCRARAHLRGGPGSAYEAAH